MDLDTSECVNRSHGLWQYASGSMHVNHTLSMRKATQYGNEDGFLLKHLHLNECKTSEKITFG